MLLRALALFSLLLVSTGCGPLLFVEAEAEEICKTVPDIEMPAMPQPMQMSVETASEFELGNQLSALGEDTATGNLELLRLTLTPTSGVSDLSFVNTAQVSVVEGENKTQIVDYSREPGTQVTALELAPTTSTDLFPYLQKEALKLSAKLSGTFPQQEWTMQVKACFKAKTKVNYTNFLK